MCLAQSKDHRVVCDNGVARGATTDEESTN